MWNVSLNPMSACSCERGSAAERNLCMECYYYEINKQLTERMMHSDNMDI